MHFYHPRWPVFHEDNHLLVVYKPAGLIMQRGDPGKPDLVSLVKQWIKTRHAKPGRVFVGMVHRLDGPVAGVVVLARTSKAAARLSEQFRTGAIEKIYLAVVLGRPATSSGRLVHHLARDGRLNRIASAQDRDSQEARLCYEVVESGRDASLLRVRLETGRRHQIRAQLAAIGCPILGDKAYGGRPLPGESRIALMAQRLSLVHPTRRETLSFETDPPQGWPWPHADASHPPLWTLEAFQREGLVLPDCGSVE